MARFELDSVKSEVGGVWDSAQAAFWIRTAEASAGKADWATATHRLLQVADVLEGSRSESRAWRDLAVTTLEMAVRSDVADEVRVAATRLLGRSWARGWVPDELLGPLRVAESQRCWISGRELGIVLERRYPQWAYGLYAAAHFAETIARASGEVPANPVDESRRFERAATLFEARGDSLAATHCTLRAAEILMEWTSQTDRARTLFRAIDRERLAPRERLWLALAQAHSPFWLDRVRALDFVTDLTDGMDSLDASFAAWNKDDVDAVAESLFGRLSVQPHDSEIDRLQSLVERFEGRRRWELEAQLRGRMDVAARASNAIAEIDAGTARKMEADALPLDGFAALVAGFNGTSPETIPVNPVARAVVAALRAPEPPLLVKALRELVPVVVETSDARSLRPLALVFAKLLPESIDPDAEAPLTELVLHFVNRAPAPSFGFATLAEHLFHAKLWRAGAAAARRALDEGEPLDEGRRDDLIARSIQWAVREGTDREMLVWLEIGAPAPGAH